jgi:hypothetical protein
MAMGIVTITTQAPKESWPLNAIRQYRDIYTEMSDQQLIGELALADGISLTVFSSVDDSEHTQTLWTRDIGEREAISKVGGRALGFVTNNATGAEKFRATVAQLKGE